METVLKIEGMHCDNCAKRLEKALSNNKNISKASVDFSKKEALINYQNLTLEKLKSLISDIGFEAK